MELWWGDSSWWGEGEEELPSSHEWHTLAGSQTAEGEGTADDEVVDFYHGTTVFVLPHIMEGGLFPSYRAGAQAMAEHFGIPTLGVYVAHSRQVAKQYPIWQTTGPIRRPGRSTSLR